MRTHHINEGKWQKAKGTKDRNAKVIDFEAMPFDVDAAVIANTRLSPDYNVLALAAPAIARLGAARPVRDGEAARTDSIRCCGGRSPFSKSCATRPARPSA